MKKVIGIIVVLLALVILATGCGISQADYDTMVAQKDEQILQLNNDIERLTPKYFVNRTAIENWLKLMPSLGISKNPEEWYQFALYYQQKALEAGYIVSVAYWRTGSSNIIIWCEVITQDGYIFYFDPDDCELVDTNLRIDMISPADLENNHLGNYL